MPSSKANNKHLHTNHRSRKMVKEMKHTIKVTVKDWNYQDNVDVPKERLNHRKLFTYNRKRRNRNWEAIFLIC